jgi:mono/diheme cytochrome c family protein
MKVRRAKIISIATLTIPLVLTAFFNAPPSGAAAVADDPATIYKAKCAMCHGPAAAKAFDPAKPEADLVKAILKGQKGEKPPYMPEYETKGITEDTAKALVAHMKSLRTSGN